VKPPLLRPPLASRRRIWPVLAALATALCWRHAASARPWQVDDLFHLQDVGHAEFDPAGRVLLVEKMGPLAEMKHFDMGVFGEIARNTPMVYDVKTVAPPRPLVSGGSPEGYALGGFSPDGRRVVVYRLQDHAFTLGVVDIASGRLQSLGVTPELWRFGSSVAWVSPTRLVAIVRPDGTPPLEFRMGFEGAEVLSELTRRQAAGVDPSVIALGSGKYLGLRPHPVPNQLVSFDLTTGMRRVLASGAFFDLAVSHGGRFAALLANGADLQYPQTTLLDVGTPEFRRSLTVVDLQSGRVSRPAAPYDLLTHLLAWAPNSDRLLVFGRIGDQAWSDGRLLVIDASRGAAVALDGVQAVLSSDMGGIPVPRADWAGEDPVLYGRQAADPGDRADWFRFTPAGPLNLTRALPASPRLLAVGPNALLLQADGALWRTTLAGGASRVAARPGATPETSLPPDAGARFSFNERPRRDGIWVREGNGGQDLRWAGAGEVPPLALQRSDQVLAVNPDGDAAVIARRDTHGVLTLDLLAGGRSSRPLDQMNGWLQGVDPARIRAVPHLAGDGQAVTSWLYLPAHLQPGGKPPLVVVAYPGVVHDTPPEQHGPDAPDALTTGSVHVLAGQGYATLIASMAPRLDLFDPTDAFVPDVMRAVDAARATGLVDGTRLALWGHSYGGYLALDVATRSSRFGAVIASAALSDLASLGVFPSFVRLHPADGLWIDSLFGWLEDGQAQTRTQAWSDPERYVRRSPLFSAGAIKAPVLLISGGIDSAPPEQREEIFSSLYRQAKPVILATYFGEGHALFSPANIKDAYRRVFRFLDDNLKPSAKRVGT
jgi:dipeptidyl aminopeptidase/acylaminoacyl peptidase